MNISKINISGIQFNLEISIKRLKRDLLDDWFPDFIEYEDVFEDNQFFIDKLSDYIDSKKKYEPSPALHFDIPKEGFTIRYSTETNIIDRLIYQGCVDIIAEKFDTIHSERIYSHRTNQDQKSIILFRYAVEEWKKYLTDIELELSKDENEVLLVTDLSNYYESISIKDLKTTLKLQVSNLSLNGEKEKQYLNVISLIESLLSSWCEPNTKRGIPQNRDASSFLSNVFLNPVDNEMLKGGFNYFRYMDDIRIVCKDKFEARKALKLLINELRKKGLNVNSKKTEILDLNNGDQKTRAFEMLQKGDKKVDQIESLLKSRTSRGIQLAVPMLHEKTISLIESGGTQERHFRFCINRLERLNRVPELKSKLNLNDITNAIINELVSQPWSTDAFSRYLSSADLDDSQLEKLRSILLNEDKNIYEWQEYHLWRIIISQAHKHNDLINKARINLIKRSYSSPVLAGSALYLCSIGDSNDKKYVVDKFKNCNDHLSQRAALIGVKSLEYSPFIKPSVEKYLVSSLKGCYKILNEKYRDIYMNKPQKLNYKDFYDELPEFMS